MTAVQTMGDINRAFLDDIISTYFEMGATALERREYAIALKMFRAVLDEPGSRAQKEKLLLSLLVKSAEAHEGLKQLYKAKLLYIRALAQYKKLATPPAMATVEILLRLASLTAQQGLYGQSVDFARQAQEEYTLSRARDPILFVRNLRATERLLQLKGRLAEQQDILSILQQVKTEALMNIPGVACVMPAVLALPV
jgi:hypothetical protein